MLNGWPFKASQNLVNRVLGLSPVRENLKYPKGILLAVLPHPPPGSSVPRRSLSSLWPSHSTSPGITIRIGLWGMFLYRIYIEDPPPKKTASDILEAALHYFGLRVEGPRASCLCSPEREGSPSSSKDVALQLESLSAAIPRPSICLLLGP